MSLVFNHISSLLPMSYTSLSSTCFVSSSIGHKPIHDFLLFLLIRLFFIIIIITKQA